MTVAEIITKFETFVEDTLDSVTALQLVNDAINEVDEEVQPQDLKKVDTSLSTTVGQTYTTSKALPSDFFLPFDYIMVGTRHVFQKPFEEQVQWRERAGYYFVDYANNVYYLTGTQSTAETITFPYWKKRTEMTDTSQTPTWPSRFHRLIPYRMAKIFFAIDQGEKGLSWDREWAMEHDKALQRFIDWDTKLKLQAMGRQTPYGSSLSDRHHDQVNL